MIMAKKNILNKGCIKILDIMTSFEPNHEFDLDFLKFYSKQEGNDFSAAMIDLYTNNLIKLVKKTDNVTCNLTRTDFNVLTVYEYRLDLG